MKTQVRVLLIACLLALAFGWAGLRRGNRGLEQRLAASPAAGERSP
jgi:hypothetical protein